VSCIFHISFLFLSVYYYCTRHTEKQAGTTIRVTACVLILRLCFVYWNSCCLHADYIYLKLPASDKRLSGTGPAQHAVLQPLTLLLAMWVLRRRTHSRFNPLNAELHPICHLLALLGAHLIFHISRIRVNYLCYILKYVSLREILKSSYLFVFFTRQDYQELYTSTESRQMTSWCVLRVRRMRLYT